MIENRKMAPRRNFFIVEIPGLVSEGRFVGHMLLRKLRLTGIVLIGEKNGNRANDY
jgi:hypothetical protein